MDFVSMIYWFITHLWQSCVGRLRDVEMWTAGSLGHWDGDTRPLTWPYSKCLASDWSIPIILASDWPRLVTTKWPDADCQDWDRDKSLQPRRWSHSWVSPMSGLSGITWSRSLAKSDTRWPVPVISDQLTRLEGGAVMMKGVIGALGFKIALFISTWLTVPTG